MMTPEQQLSVKNLEFMCASWIRSFELRNPGLTVLGARVYRKGGEEGIKELSDLSLTIHDDT